MVSHTQDAQREKKYGSVSVEWSVPRVYNSCVVYFKTFLTVKVSFCALLHSPVSGFKSSSEGPVYALTPF